MNLNDITGEWTSNDDRPRAYFTCVNKTAKGIEISTVSILASKSNSYETIESLIASLPLYLDDPQKLSRYIAVDSARGFGTDIPELGIVAYIGQSHMDRPIAKISREDGSSVFVPHPQINNLVKRYR